MKRACSLQVRFLSERHLTTQLEDIFSISCKEIPNTFSVNSNRAIYSNFVCVYSSLNSAKHLMKVSCPFLLLLNGGTSPFIGFVIGTILKTMFGHISFQINHIWSKVQWRLNWSVLTFISSPKQTTPWEIKKGWTDRFALLGVTNEEMLQDMPCLAQWVVANTITTILHLCNCISYFHGNSTWRLYFIRSIRLEPM